ncbi:Uncharacterised protein [Vibrio cholerae]|nr:Uncharacterised protein [Vibrio cholerae]
MISILAICAYCPRHITSLSAPPAHSVFSGRVAALSSVKMRHPNTRLN